METPDWNDSHLLSDRANACVDIANRYRKARQQYAEAKRFLDLKVALAYKTKDLPKKASLEKAYLFILEMAFGTAEEEVIRAIYSDFIKCEADYKGLEKVLDAEQARLILCQSLIKNQVRNG
jgi:hypothetical protein